MKITEISYRSLRTGRGYNNTSVEARAIVEAHESPEKALADLRFWVDKQVDDTLKREDAYATAESIEQSIEWKRDQVARLDKEIAAKRAVVREHGALAKLARESGLPTMATLLEMAE